MPLRARSRRPPGRILLRFALTSLVVFLLIGLGFALVRTGEIRDREERAAADRAALVVRYVVAPMLEPSDLAAPVTGSRYEDLRERIHAFTSADGRVVRVKIWSADGTVVFSDDPDQVGTRPGVGHELREALDGEIVSEISSLEGSENASERRIAERLFETYVPLRGDDGTIRAVVEVYQDYSAIQAEIDAFVRTLWVSLGIGLLILFVAILPVMVGVTRTLRRQNEQLLAQAGQLEELLEHEQRTVAELRELDRLKSDFVAAASHELRTPLTSIRGYVHVLRQTEAGQSPVVAEGLAAIDRQSGRLSRLIGNLLREGRLEGDDGDQPVVDVDLAVLLRQVRADLHDAGGRIRIEAPDDLPTVACDAERLIEICTNLVDNALKYSPPDAPVTVGVAVDDDTLTVWVRDRGIGIPEEEQHRIFERFYQADQSATRPFGGVGLGLHIVRGLAEGAGGDVRVESRPGEGSTFTVRLPLEPRRGEPRASASRTAAGA